ncbi:hypothetical protein H8356DRAFT_1360612 [Neocallimastix lanati (nom. inval.)]|nr:hypothetical protein H8356DRAFT_1360612 [Neocallimastix sp. JGI-2020a]
MCYFCKDECHKKYNCPIFNHFEYLKYRMVNEEISFKLLKKVLTLTLKFQYSKSNTTNEKEEIEGEVDLSKRKIFKLKEIIKIDEFFQDLNDNNNIINDDKLNKDKEVKNYIDKNKYKINKESNKYDDKNINVNNNKTQDSNIKNNKNNCIKNLNESVHENNNYVDKSSCNNKSNNKNSDNFKDSIINNYKEQERYTNLAKLTNMKPYEIIKDSANTKFDNYFFIHPMVKSLCRFTSVEKFDIIAPVVEDQAMEKIACYIKGIRKNKSINTLVKEEPTSKIVEESS